MQTLVELTKTGTFATGQADESFPFDFLHGDFAAGARGLYRQVEQTEEAA